jgi:ubiquinone/menaquinone biosynthesis C-methylase UbiE
MLPTVIRENLVARTLPREPEPDLVMDTPENVEAFAVAGRVDGVMSANYLFHSARITQLIQGCKRVVDLGCGPATQLGQIAGLNPDTHFFGVDLSEGMLEDGRRHVQDLGLSNVEFQHGSMTRVAGIEDASADAVISTLALHHLPSFDDLRQTFKEVRRILKPGGSLYLVDLGRLKSLKSVLYFAYMNRNHQPHLFSLDYERSLRAAFVREDFERLAAEELAPGATVYQTFRLGVLLLVMTPDQPLRDAAMRAKLQAMRRALPKQYRQQLDDIRLFFKLGGLKDDPFT